jgi:hypothetical protein
MGEQRLPIYSATRSAGANHAEHLQIFDALLLRRQSGAGAVSAHLQGRRNTEGADQRHWQRRAKPSLKQPEHAGDLHPPAASARDRNAVRAGTPRWQARSAYCDAHAQARDADIVIVRAPLPPNCCGAARLRAAIRHAPGSHDPDQAASAAGVLWPMFPGVNARSVAEHVLFVALALLRNSRAMDRDLREHRAGWRAASTQT